jgi:dTDP-4-dehydrorhamnose reductase
MIIGRGLMAASLKDSDREDTIFFCSGVSNSMETNPNEFIRELNLLSAQDKTKRLVYFSTISIFNPSKKDSPYIKHKTAVEKYIANNFSSHIILRLPNMVGAGGNASNLFPYFLNAIFNRIEVVIFDKTYRDLLDVSDVPLIVDGLINKNYSGTMNICVDNPPSVLDLYLYMCKLTGRAPFYRLEKGENPFYADNKEFNNFLRTSDITCKTDWREIVNGYVLVNQVHFS